MTIALLGIVGVQVFWIKNTIQITEEQFSENVKFALSKVSEEIKNNEFEKFYSNLSKRYKEEGKRLNKADVKKFIFEQIDTLNNQRFTYSQSIVEQNYKISSEFFENDSINFKEIYNKEEIVINKKNNLLTKDLPAKEEEKIIKIGRFTTAEKASLINIFDAITSRQPIHQRVSNKEITLRLANEFKSKGINTSFKFGVYSNGLATQLKSGYFRKEKGKNYQVPMFVDKDGKSDYKLYVKFPDKKKFILSSIYKMLILSVLFILIIILVFSSTLYQLLKQKKISEIKTDFINNMTHEFKTPIATINLALDAIKNPKIIEDKAKVQRYVKMIREENKRMHAQVENVLRISKLEKKELNLNKEAANVNKTLEDAINHVMLLINSKEGKISTVFDEEETEVLANKFHLTNVFVNVLENAIKYSEKPPKIKVETHRTAKNILINITDNGIGMSKSVQKQIFKKFYREEKGNVHNVKGHGLGLSYVKKIINLHQGTIHVESEKGVGSTFAIKLPTI